MPAEATKPPLSALKQNLQDFGQFRALAPVYPACPSKCQGIPKNTKRQKDSRAINSDRTFSLNAAWRRLFLTRLPGQPVRRLQCIAQSLDTRALSHTRGDIRLHRTGPTHRFGNVARVQIPGSIPCLVHISGRQQAPVNRSAVTARQTTAPRGGLAVQSAHWSATCGNNRSICARSSGPAIPMPSSQAGHSAGAILHSCRAFMPMKLKPYPAKQSRHRIQCSVVSIPPSATLAKPTGATMQIPAPKKAANIAWRCREETLKPA